VLAGVVPEGARILGTIGDKAAVNKVAARHIAEVLERKTEVKDLLSVLDRPRILPDCGAIECEEDDCDALSDREDSEEMSGSADSGRIIARRAAAAASRMRAAAACGGSPSSGPPPEGAVVGAAAAGGGPGTAGTTSSAAFGLPSKLERRATAVQAWVDAAPRGAFSSAAPGSDQAGFHVACLSHGLHRVIQYLLGSHKQV
jgi:hypothetical protein